MATARPPDLIPVTDVDDLRQVHRRLIVPNFAPDERGSEDAYVAGASAGGADVLAARGAAGEWLGVATTERFAGSDATLLSWLAVDREGRGAGVGAALLAATVARVRDSGSPLLVGEIEPPGVPADERYGDPRRRAAFYRRHGFRALDFAYEQPPMNDGGPWVPMIMITPTSPDVAAAELLAFLRAYTGGPPAPAWVSMRERLASINRVATRDLAEVFGC